MTHEQLSKRTFELSCKLMDLYTTLIRQNELELSTRVLKYGLSIRKHAECAASSLNQMEFTEATSMAYDMAVQTRYWLKLVQMKHPLCKPNDECVELLNGIINSLNYMLSQNDNKYQFQLTYPVN
ncbi:MAG: four helix bundle protein [Cytophagaceae bacterium]